MTTFKNRASTPIERIREAFGVEESAQSSTGWHSAHCKAHNDKSKSLSFIEKDDGSVYIQCFAGCETEAILKAVKLKPADLYPHTNYKPVYRPRPELDVVTLACDKLIPWQFLINEGVKDGYRWNGQTGCSIDYYTEAGELHTKIRVRVATTGKRGSFWDKDTPGEMIPYGLHRLNMAREQGYLLAGEGESDGWTCWFHNIPYLGIPGATNTKCLDGKVLNDIPRVYVIQEPDDAGQKFYKMMHAQLRKTGYTGEIFALPFKPLTGSKDPNDLHKRLKGKGLKEAIADALKRAIPSGDESEEQEQTVDLAAIDAAIEAKDIEKLMNALPTLAQLPKSEYLVYETKIKAAFKKLINMNTFSAALSDERKATAAGSPRTGMVRDDMPYERTAEGMLYTFKGETIFLSNFAAEIITDITTDDGVETARSYELDVTLFNEHQVIELPAKEFSRCEWVDEQLGASAIITAGQSTKAHLVNAIKTCSQAEKQYNYAHTGWRKVNGKMVYLHNDGCVSQVSQVNISNENYLTQKNQTAKTASQASLEDNKNGVSQVSQVSQVNTQVRVKLDGTLSLYKLPDGVNVDIREAILSSLRYLDLASDIITVPLYASLWRSVLGRVNYGVHLAGQSGLGKTELVVLLQQYFGTEFSSDNLPGSWESTDNALETLLFKAKEAVVVVDDFKPNGSSVDQQRWHSRADRIFRSIGNGIGRSRMTSDLKQRAQRPPRCLLISTGEDFPKGQSCQARGIMLTMTEKIVVGESAKRLKQAQRDGRDGVYVQVMTAYLQWLAPRIETIQAQLKNLTEDERDRISLPGHARAGTNTANMIIGMKYFLQFAVESGAISQEDGQSVLNRCLSAFQTIAKNAASSNDEQKPSEQWKRLLIAAITNKSAHLTTDDRLRPCPGVEYGWVTNLHEVDIDGTSDTREMLRPGGDHIGWICGDDIYLDPGLAYKAVKAMGAASGDDITTAEPMLRKLLAQDKVLASTMQHLKSRPTLTVRRRLDNAQRNVLHLKKSTLFSDDSLSTYENVDSLDSDDYQTASQAPSGVSQVPDSARTKSAQSLDSGHDSALDSHVNPVAIASEKIEKYAQAQRFLEESAHKGCRIILDRRDGRFDVRMVQMPKNQDDFVQVWQQYETLKESLVQVLRDQESA